MYENLLNINRKLSVVLSMLLLLALIATPMAAELVAEHKSAVLVIVSILAGTVLLDRLLAKLAMDEALRQYMSEPDQA